MAFTAFFMPSRKVNHRPPLETLQPRGVLPSLHLPVLAFGVDPSAQLPEGPPGTLGCFTHLPPWTTHA
jgi:hypothetical protein